MLGRMLVPVLAVCLLAGCAATPPIDDATGASLQASVVAAANAAAAGDATSALAQLDSLDGALAAATANDSVSSDRSARIAAAIALVRRDLQAMLASQTAVTPTEVADDSVDSTTIPATGNNGNGNGNGNGNNGKDKGNKKD